MQSRSLYCYAVNRLCLSDEDFKLGLWQALIDVFGATRTLNRIAHQWLVLTTHSADQSSLSGIGPLLSDP